MVETYHVSALAKVIEENCFGIDKILSGNWCSRSVSWGIWTLNGTGRCSCRYSTTVRGFKRKGNVVDIQAIN